MRLHQCEKVLHCTIDNCNWTGGRLQAFRSHVTYYHSKPICRKMDQSDIVSSHACSVDNCDVTFANMTDLLSHFRIHFEYVMRGEKLTCPYAGCNIQCSSKPAFATHVYRRHRIVSVEN